MLLGKRPRPPIKRTTSMTEFTLDLSNMEVSSPSPQPSDPHSPFKAGPLQSPTDGLDQRLLTAASPRNNNHRRNSADYAETPHFLRACSLCKRRLIPGRDIYMYRGDSAFCSLECRQQQMKQDERREKCSLAASKKLLEAPSNSAGSEVVAAKAETVTAM